MGDISDVYKNLIDIVPSVNKQPTIINPESNFVVVTYWWGAPNQNANIARPCIVWFEGYIEKLIETVIKLFTIMSQNQSKVKSNKKFLLNNFIPHLLQWKSFKEFIFQTTNEYLN